MAQSIKSSAISAAKWNTISNLGNYGISFFLSIILARMLEPAEFGLTGMLSIFIAIALVFINSGLSTAIIRTKSATTEDYSTVFYFNITVSTAFYLLFFFLAPLIADFYHEPILVPLTRLTTLVFFINSFGIVQNAILIKEINFKKQAFCYLSGLAIAAIIASTMAFLNFGVYSIVGQILSQAIVTNIFLWTTSIWRPKKGFNKNSFLKLWSFGSKILATNIVASVVENIDNILIGKLFTATQLGIYIRAKGTKQLPEQIFAGVLSSTSFAILAKVNDNDSEFNRLHLHFFNLAVFIFIPVMFGLIAVAESFTITLYSAKWAPAVPLLRIIALSSLGYFLGTLFSQTIMAKGDGKLYFRLTTANKLLGLSSIPFGLFWGIIPFLWSMVGISLFCLYLDLYFTGKLINIKITTYLKYLIKPIIASTIMFLSINFIPMEYFGSYPLLLIVQFFSGIAIYSFLSFVLKIKAFKYTIDTIREQYLIFLNRFRKQKIQ